MALLPRDDVKALMERSETPCISIFMPTHRAGAETQQDPVRLKNLLRDAELKLIALGLRSPVAKDLLGPVRRLLGDSLFWQHQSDGLAVFRSPSTFRYYRLPTKFDELVVVSDRFHLKPLLQLRSGDGEFYVLALSQNQVRLLRCRRNSANEVDLEGVPANIAEALQYDDPERQLQFHTRAPGRKGERAAIFHGHGTGVDDAKDNILRYFRQIDQGLYEILRDQRAPLVLAAVEYLLPIYREANTYPHLVTEGITGNPEGMRGDELHRAAWAIVEPYFVRAEEAGALQYQRLVGTGRTSKDVEETVLAAYHGRVEVLFVPVGRQKWGRVDPAAGVVLLHEQPEPGDEDLLDFAAIHTTLNRGTVYVVPRERMPDDALVAAVFHY